MTKNDTAWDLVFEKTDTLKRIEHDGFAVLTADQLKLLGNREPRLMAKQDTLKSRPGIFKQHDIAIFPIKNGEYILFSDPEQRTFYKFKKEESSPPINIYESEIDLLSFNSYPRDGSFTESQAIDFAYVSSLLRTFLREESMHLTIRGRVRSGEFQFVLPGTQHSVNVSGVQIEVDADYESENCIYLIEAKIGRRDNFHIRQLFYPYLEWSRRSQKRIRPIFLAYTNSKYFLYEFGLTPIFGELQVIQQRGFTINES